MYGAISGYLGTIDWTTLTSGLQTTFESAVTDALPVVGAIIAAFVAFKAIKRFVKA
jgi:hypothetical protein